jgi:hypothetical protein
MLSGQLASRVGSFDDAYERLREARSELDASGLTSDVRLVDARTAESMIFEGRSSEALAIVERLLASGSAGLSAEMALLQRIRGYALMNLGDTAGAADALTLSLQSAQDLEASYEVALTLVAQRSLARLTGNDQLASDLEAPSRTILDRLGVMAVVEPPSAAGSRPATR